MLLQAIGAALPAAAAIALSPFPVIGIVLVLAGPRGRSAGPFFAVGWLAGLTAVTVLVTIVLADADDADSTSATIAAWGRVAAGGALVVMGGRKWSRRPRDGEVAAAPRWMASLDAIAPPRALLLGVGLAAANPKNLVLTAAAGTSMVEAGVRGSQLAIAVVVFVLIASGAVIGAVVARLIGGPRGLVLLDGARSFMVANSAVITAVVLILLGSKILGDGLAGLDR